jgi:apolipoprotein N-acyltransferase
VHEICSISVLYSRPEQYNQILDSISNVAFKFMGVITQVADYFDWRDWRGGKRAAVALLAPLASGVGVALCIGFGELWWLLWFVLVPYSLALRVERGHATRIGFFVGGLACMLIGLDFVRTAFQGDLFWSWITLSVIISGFWILAAWAARLISAEIALPMSFVLPLSWVALEFVRMHFVAAMVGAPFSYMQLGTAAVECRHLVQVADIGGVYAVTWVIVSINGAIVDVLDALRSARKAPAIWNSVFSVSFVVVVLPATWLYGAWRLSQAPTARGPVVALVPGSLRRVLQSGGVESLTRQAAIAAQREVNTDETEHEGRLPALFVWGEGAYGSIEDSSVTNSHVRELEELSAGLGAAILTGCEREGAIPGTRIGVKYNSVAYATPAKGFQGCYDKIYLAPGREFYPPIAMAMGLLPTPESGGPTGPYHRGNDRRTFSLTTSGRAYRFAATICNEVSCASHHRSFATGMDGGTMPDFFIGCACESAFAGPLYSEYSASAQRLRAIECRRAFARVAEDGISAFVDGNGDVLQARRTAADSAALVYRIPIDHRFSLYAACGDWLPIASCGMLGLLAAIAATRSWRRIDAQK